MQKGKTTGTAHILHFSFYILYSLVDEFTQKALAYTTVFSEAVWYQF